MDDLTGIELFNAIREDIINEQKAIISYESHLSRTSNVDVKKILNELVRDEKIHLRHLQGLLLRLDYGRETEANEEAVEEYLEMTSCE